MTGALQSTLQKEEHLVDRDRTTSSEPLLVGHEFMQKKLCCSSYMFMC